MLSLHIRWHSSLRHAHFILCRKIETMAVLNYKSSTLFQWLLIYLLFVFLNYLNVLTKDILWWPDYICLIIRQQAMHHQVCVAAVEAFYPCTVNHMHPSIWCTQNVGDMNVRWLHKIDTDLCFCLFFLKKWQSRKPIQCGSISQSLLLQRTLFLFLFYLTCF